MRALDDITVALSQTLSGHKVSSTNSIKAFPACAPVTTLTPMERTGQQVGKLLGKAHKLFIPWKFETEEH